MKKNGVRAILGVVLGCGLLLGLVLWTHLRFHPQYDEIAHQAFSTYIASHLTVETITTYEGSQNYEAKGPVFFIIASFFAKATGFDLRHLRVLTLLFSVTAIIGFALLLRLVPKSSPESSAFLVCLPYYLILSVTFMTDVPSLALLLLGLYGYLSFIKTNSVGHLIIGFTCVTLVAYIRVDYVYIVAGIIVGCVIHSRLTFKILLAALIPIVLRIPLFLLWGGLAAPPAQVRGHAVELGFNLHHLFFSLSVVGLYFWPLLVGNLAPYQKKWTLQSLVFSAGIILPSSIFFAPQIVPDNVDRYAGTLRSIILAFRLPHISQVAFWTVLVIVGTILVFCLLRVSPSDDIVISCIKAACLIGLLIQTFRGQVIYERYLLEVFPLLLLLYLGSVPFKPALWLWFAWAVTLQLVQLGRASLL